MPTCVSVCVCECVRACVRESLSLRLVRVLRANTGGVCVLCFVCVCVCVFCVCVSVCVSVCSFVTWDAFAESVDVRRRVSRRPPLVYSVVTFVTGRFGTRERQHIRTLT